MKVRFSWISVFLPAVMISTAAHADVRDDHWSPIVDSIQEQHRAYSLTATAHADGLLQVMIKNADGSPLFESVYPVAASDGTTRLEWTYRSPDGSILTRSNQLPADLYPTIRSMSLAGKDVVRMLGNGLQPGSHNLRPGKIKTNDTWGCDLPEAVDMECTNRGNCCDSHDACYAVGHCSYWSWLGVQSLWCEACNLTAALCITTGLGSTGQPSICCAYGNCGTEQGPPGGGPTKDLEPGMEPSDPEGGGMTEWGIDSPWGVSTGSGTCTFPNGMVVPCG
jgi:hypothetical protein